MINLMYFILGSLVTIIISKAIDQIFAYRKAKRFMKVLKRLSELENNISIEEEENDE
jgi:biopolymer transport protein ExbB/TolQ